jgi:hypothetical protein
MLDINRLKEKIKAAFEAEQTENADYDGSLNRISQKIAEGCIEEIQQMTITYTAGLVAPSGGGPVTGVFEFTIT